MTCTTDPFKLSAPLSNLVATSLIQLQAPINNPSQYPLEISPWTTSFHQQSQAILFKFSDPCYIPWTGLINHPDLTWKITLNSSAWIVNQRPTSNRTQIPLWTILALWTRLSANRIEPWTRTLNQSPNRTLNQSEPTWTDLNRPLNQFEPCQLLLLTVCLRFLLCRTPSFQISLISSPSNSTTITTFYGFMRWELFISFKISWGL